MRADSRRSGRQVTNCDSAHALSVTSPLSESGPPLTCRGRTRRKYLTSVGGNLISTCFAQLVADPSLSLKRMRRALYDLGTGIAKAARLFSHGMAMCGRARHQRSECRPARRAMIYPFDPDDFQRWRLQFFGTHRLINVDPHKHPMAVSIALANQRPRKGLGKVRDHGRGSTRVFFACSAVAGLGTSTKM